MQRRGFFLECWQHNCRLHHRCRPQHRRQPSTWVLTRGQGHSHWWHCLWTRTHWSPRWYRHSKRKYDELRDSQIAVLQCLTLCQTVRIVARRQYGRSRVFKTGGSARSQSIRKRRIATPHICTVRRIATPHIQRSLHSTRWCGKNMTVAIAKVASTVIKTARDSVMTLSAPAPAEESKGYKGHWHWRYGQFMRHMSARVVSFWRGWRITTALRMRYSAADLGRTAAARIGPW